MKKLLIGILCVSMISPSFVFAKEENEIENRQYGRFETEKFESRDSDERSREQKESLRMADASSTKIEADQKSKQILKARKEARKIVMRLEAAISRVQKLSDRTSERLNRLEASGVNIAISRAHLVDAKNKLADAIARTVVVKTALDSAIASSTSKTDLKVALRNAEVSVKEVSKIIQNAHRDVAQAISSVKPGFNKPRPATTTPDVLMPIISSVVTNEVSTTSVTVSWSTNEMATGKLFYGTSTPLNASVSTTTLSTGHSFNLTGLTASTTYQLLLESKDAAGNTATTSATFVTAV